MTAPPFRTLLSMLALLLAVVFAVPALAGEHDAALGELKLRAGALSDIASDGVITRAQRDQGLELYVARAKALDPAIASVDALMAVKTTAPTTAESRTEGILTFLASSRVIAGVLGVVCAIILAGYFIKDLRALFGSIPLAAYEVGLYGLSLAFVAGGMRVADWGTYLGFVGCLGVAGSLVLSAQIRNKEPNPTGFCALLTLLWAPVAIWYHSELIGFITAMALMGAFGFSAAASPLCYMIGFKDEDSVGRATVAGFFLVAVFGALRVLGNASPALQVFEPGALFMGSFVGGLGTLILASKWYGRGFGFYAVMQVVALLVGLTALGAGSVFGIPELQKIGGTFFCLWLIEKFSEVPVHSVRGWSFVGLVAAIGVYYAADAIQSNLEVIRPYVLFL